MPRIGSRVFPSRVFPLCATLALTFLFAFPSDAEGQFQFRRGDANLDDLVNIADAVGILDATFGGPPLACDSAGDVNDDGGVDIADPIALLAFLFSGGVAPPAPFPDCGSDPTPDALDCAMGGSCPPDIPPTVPFLNSVTPLFGRPGDVLLLEGNNFDPSIAGNTVRFVSSGGTIELLGLILDVMVAPFVPGIGAMSEMTVMVPSGVRSGTIELDVALPGGGFATAGSLPFDAAPVIVETGIGDNGDGVGILRDINLNIFPAEIALLGRNFEGAIAVEFTDGIQTLASPNVSFGLPPNANYTPGPAVEALTVEVPTTLLPQICTSARVTVTVTRTLPSGTMIESFPFEIPYLFLDIASGQTSDVDLHAPVVHLPDGVRGGEVVIDHRLVAGPPSSRWTVIPEYQDPDDPTGNTWLPCTPIVDGLSSETGMSVLAGSSVVPSVVDGSISPGDRRRFRWASEIDLPASEGVVVTRIRVLPSDPIPTLGTGPAICIPPYISEPIVIDNRAEALDVVLTRTEEFDDAAAADPSSTALWDGSGVLTAPLGAGASDSFGTGTVDLQLNTGEYLIDTDAATIFDVTSGTAIDLLPGQPGASLGEIHLRSLVIDPGAMVTGVGSAPAIIRCSGDGTDAFLALDLAGTIDFRGEEGTMASNFAAGTGGPAGPGGGAGGDGASVFLNPQNQTASSVIFATDGGGSGGGAGPLSTLVLPGTSASTPRSGPGGGGGHAERGEDGVNTFIATAPYNTKVGRGGPARGDSLGSTIHGGGGGGGGGATIVRLSATNTLEKFGGGGGGGGGAIEFVVQGRIVVSGSVLVDGGDGRVGSSGTQSGAGGGGAGGTIALRASGDLNIEVNTAELSALGGFGGITNPGLNQLRGGNGSVGRIILEPGGQLGLPGVVELDGLDVSLMSPGLSQGIPVGAVNLGSGIDGPLDETVLSMSGVYTIDTDTGAIEDPTGALVLTAASGGGLFELTSLHVPADVTLRAFGAEPLEFLVDGPAQVLGTIDVSGEDGGISPAPGVAAAGGLAGPAGGAGGASGEGAGVTAFPGLDGSLPPNLPASLINPPMTGGGSPIPLSPIFPAEGGTESVELSPLCSGGSGGGGAHTLPGSDTFEEVSCAPPIAAGGTEYGSSTFLVADPLQVGASLELRTGGSGGGGGAGGSDGTGVSDSGSSGGGGGGYVRIQAETIDVLPGATLDASGGDAFQAGPRGGNGGAGAGGAIRLVTPGTLNIDAATTIRVSGGDANQPPVGAAYVPNFRQSGGDGGVGRLRLESSLGFANSANSPIDPEPIVGTFETQGLARFVALSQPFRLTVDDGVVRVGDAALDPPVVDQTNAAGVVRVLFEGAPADPASPNLPGEFSPAVADVSLLEPFEFLRFRVYLYSSATEAPTVESIDLPYRAFP